MTTSVNQTLTTTEQIFKEVVWTPMLQAGENWLSVEVPFLGVPVVKSIFTTIVNHFSDALYSAIVLRIDITYLKLKNSAAQTAYESAAESLFVIYEEKGIDSNEFKTARDAARVALGKLLSYTT